MRDLWSKFLGYQKKTENKGQEMNQFQSVHSFTQRKVLRPMVPPLLWTQARPSWSQTYFYRRTIKLWENFPWEVTGFSTSCHSWEVSSGACWKTCSEQTQITGLQANTNHWTHLWDKRTSVRVTRTHWYNQCSALKTHKWKVNRKLMPLHRCNSFKSWRWLQCGGQIKHRFMFMVFWGGTADVSVVV